LSTPSKGTESVFEEKLFGGKKAAKTEGGGILRTVREVKNAIHFLGTHP